MKEELKKVWYLKHPTAKYYEGNVKKQAIKASAKIIDIKFIGKDESATDCPKMKATKKPEPSK